MRQRKILIMMSSLYGHLNCTFALSNILRKRGYKVIYAVSHSKQKYLQSHGFETVICQPNLFTLANGKMINEKKDINDIFNKCVDRLTNVHKKYTIKKVEEMNAVIRFIQPDLVLLDSFLPFNYLFFETPKPPTILLQTMLATKWRSGIPTLNSKFLPKDNKFSFFKRKYSWWKEKVRSQWQQFSNIGTSRLKVTSRILGKHIIKRYLDFSYVFQPSIKQLPEFVLAPKSLDFHELSPVSQLYLASSINPQRKKQSHDRSLDKLIRNLKENYSKNTWIYCSLGTLNETHNKNCKYFFEKVISIFKEKKDWRLIVSTGELNTNFFENNLANVYLFQRVPQLEILRYCQIMITHGGLNSVLECIHFLTPMLVYPLNGRWDQNGNAARVVHYGLGLRGEINQDQPKEIRQKIERLILDCSFKNNIQQMNNNITTENGIEEALALIQSKII